MGKKLENIGVLGVTAIVATVLVAYSFWGASMLKAKQESSPFSTNTTQIFTVNL